MNKKGKKLLLGAALALSVTAALSSGALAADYRFAGAADTEYYPSTCYEDLYGAQYNYGGMNAVDLEEPEQAFGFAGWSITGAAERVLLPNEIKQSGEYGLPFDDAPPAPAVMEAALTETQPAVATPVLQTPAYTSVQGMERPDGSVGSVSIPSLGINMAVWEGETNSSMAKGLGHYSSSSGWDGNVCVCGHNRGARYVIGSIKDLQPGDTISYTTVFGTRSYEVSYVGVISYTDWSLLQATSDNRITLTTCLANQPNYRVCVQAIERVK